MSDDNIIPRVHRNPQLEKWQGKAKLPPAYKRAPKQEKETKERLIGGRAIPASGAKFRKADVEVPGLARIECKATGAKSFSVTREMIRKVEDAAMANDQIPFIEIEFVNGRGVVEESACVIPRHALTALLNRVADATGITATDRRSEQRLERNNRRLSPKQRS